MADKRSQITTVNTFDSWIEGLKSQVEMWRDNMPEDEDVYFLLGEFHSDKFPKYSLDTPEEAAGSICKAAYAPDVFRDGAESYAFSECDKTFFGLLTMKSDNISSPDHPQVFTLEELIDKAESLFEVCRLSGDKYALVGGVAYDGINVSAANNKDYKRFNKLRFDPEIFSSSPDRVGNLSTGARLDWYGTIIVKEKHLSEKWRKNLADKRGGS